MMSGLKRIFEIFITLACLGLVVIYIFFLIVVQRISATTNEVRRANETWQALQSSYQQARRIHSDYLTKRGVIAELESRKTTRIDWNVLVSELQRVLPVDVKVAKLSIRADGQPVSSEDPDAQLVHVLKQYTVLIDGKIASAANDEAITTMEAVIAEAPSWKKIAKSIKLLGVYSEPRKTERNFRIQVITESREL